MKIFAGFMPYVGESPYAYAPWGVLCGVLLGFAILQIVISRKMNTYFLRAMAGENKAGRTLFERLENAKWNDQIRSFCRSNGLLIIHRGQKRERNSISDSSL